MEYRTILFRPFTELEIIEGDQNRSIFRAEKDEKYLGVRAKSWDLKEVTKERNSWRPRRKYSGSIRFLLLPMIARYDEEHCCHKNQSNIKHREGRARCYSSCWARVTEAPFICVPNVCPEYTSNSAGSRRPSDWWRSGQFWFMMEKTALILKGTQRHRRTVRWVRVWFSGQTISGPWN